MSFADFESQIDELLALESIYDQTCFRTSRPIEGLTAEQLGNAELLAGFFTAEINFSSPVFVKLKSLVRRKKEETNGEICDNPPLALLASAPTPSVPSPSNLHPQSDALEVTSLDLEVLSLPPIALSFEFPRDYPSSSPPTFSLTSKWMPHSLLTRVAKRLDALWQESEGMEIIFSWTSFLKEELVDFLSLASPVDLTCVEEGEEEADPRCVRDIVDADLLLPAIKENDEVAREKIFASTVFQCNVCFEDDFGSNAIQFLPCKHVFCKECMKDYFTVQIKDGSVRCLTCPEDKCTSVALPIQVKSLVAPELFAVYDRLLLQTTLDTMADVVYCPRKICSSPVMVEPGLTMAICPSCKFAFCFFCKMTYHGVAPCKLESSKFKELHREYSSADAAGRELMEKRYSKAMLKRVFEEQRSEQYLEKNTKRCPGCKASVSKVDGCNKMTCTKCQRYFCWICGLVLPKEKPYLHFNAPGAGGCYGKLFEGMEDGNGDDDDDSDDDDSDDDFEVGNNVDEILDLEYHWGLQNLNWDG